MKLATYHDGSRDGHLVVVSRDLATAHYASGVATRLQQVLDDWNFVSPQLEEISQTLNHGKARHAFAFEPRRCMAPLPRAFARVSGSAFPGHLDRLHVASGEASPESLPTEPLTHQRTSDDLLGPCADITAAGAEHVIESEAEIAVVTGDVAMGTAPEAAIDGIRLVMLANSVRLRHLIATERVQGAGLQQDRPATAFSPVAVTPDELLHAWRGGRIHLNLDSTWNGRRVGRRETGDNMHLHFGELIAHLCKTRNVRAGSIVGSGIVGSSIVDNRDASRGPGCTAEERATETLEGAAPQTAYIQPGDTICIEMMGLDGMSVFGAIEQKVVVLP